nr:hypothetical protein [Escherichia coli]
MRFSRGGETVNIVYPDVFFVPGILHHQLFPRRVALYAGDYQNRGNHRQRHPWRRVSTPPTTGRAAVTRSSKPI